MRADAYVLRRREPVHLSSTGAIWRRSGYCTNVRVQRTCANKVFFPVSADINRLEPRKSAKSATRDLQIIFASGIASRDASRDEDYTLIRRDQGCAICSRLEARTEMAGRCAGSGSTIRGSYQGPSTKLRGGIAADTKLIIRTAQQGR